MARRDEPEITQIAAYIARRFPDSERPTEEAVQEWRYALRHARATGTVHDLTTMIEAEAPEDPTLQKVCGYVGS